MTPPDDLTAAVKALAREEGFARAGVAPAGQVRDAEAYRRWLARGMHGSMAYLERNVELRLRPDRLVGGARSVLCLAVSYAPAGGPAAGAGEALVARYARGRDYHRVLKRRCLRLLARMRALAPGFRGRAFVDFAPILERSLAASAGIGWLGRNHCLVAPDLGSYVLLCEIVSDLPLVPDAPMPSQCAGCDACVRACPTGALTAEGLDARRCLSYLTVEHRGPIDREFWPRFGRRLVGCDACQEACPHNRGAPAGDAALRPARPPLGGATLAAVLAWTPHDWDVATRGSAARRASWEMLLRNAAIAAGNSADTREIPHLITALDHPPQRRCDLEPIIQWARHRLGNLSPEETARG